MIFKIQPDFFHANFTHTIKLLFSFLKTTFDSRSMRFLRRLLASRSVFLKNSTRVKFHDNRYAQQGSFRYDFFGYKWHMCNNIDTWCYSPTSLLRFGSETDRTGSTCTWQMIDFVTHWKNVTDFWKNEHSRRSVKGCSRHLGLDKWIMAYMNALLHHFSFTFNCFYWGTCFH